MFVCMIFQIPIVRDQQAWVRIAWLSRNLLHLLEEAEGEGQVESFKKKSVVENFFYLVVFSGCSCYTLNFLTGPQQWKTFKKKVTKLF